MLVRTRSSHSQHNLKRESLKFSWSFWLTLELRESRLKRSHEDSSWNELQSLNWEIRKEWVVKFSRYRLRSKKETMRKSFQSLCESLIDDLSLNSQVKLIISLINIKFEWQMNAISKKNDVFWTCFKECLRKKCVFTKKKCALTASLLYRAFRIFVLNSKNVKILIRVSSKTWKIQIKNQNSYSNRLKFNWNFK